MRTYALPVALVLCVAGLAACGGSEEAAPPAAEPPAEAETPAPEAPAAAEEPVEPAPAPLEASCEEKRFPSQGADHVESLPEGFEYNSFPPTSGPHAPQTVIWNAYADPLPQLNLVHNLEHGGVVVQFGPDVAPEDVQAITEWYLDSPDGLVLAPLPELGSSVALTAWRHLLTCDGYDEGAFTAFRDTYRFHGPEAIPPESMKPGM